MTHHRRDLMKLAAMGVLSAHLPSETQEPNPLQAAIESGSQETVKKILDADPGAVNRRFADGRAPLHVAAAAGRPEIVMLLSTSGANLSAGPESPLLAAVDHPDAAAAKDMSLFLLGNGSDPKAKRKNGSTALHLAARRGYAEIAWMLVHRGADPAARDGEGRTPAAVATGDAVATLRDAARIPRVYFGQRYAHDLRGAAVVRDDTAGLDQHLINQFVILAHRDFAKIKEMLKAEPKLLMTRATWDELAVEATAHMGLVEMASHLAELGSPVSTCTAVMLGLPGTVEEMIRDRRCLEERGAHDLPLLAYTAWGAQRTEIAAMLIKAGADVEVRAFGMTTLHIAAGRGHLELAELLLKSGANVNAAAVVRGQRVTPLESAVRAKQEKMAALLKDRGGV